MRASEIRFEDLTNEVIDKILFNNIIDDDMPGDCIMVFGSNKALQYRVPKAVELYKKNRAEKILMSGGKDIDVGDKRLSEALAMQEKALELGIPAEDIIIETFSQRSTKENVIGSLLQLDRVLGLNNIKRILLVTTFYHMRRCFLMAKTYMPDWFEFTMCPANDNNTLKHNWFLNEEGTKRARTEALKIISYIKEGSISDFDI